MPIYEGLEKYKRNSERFLEMNFKKTQTGNSILLVSSIRDICYCLLMIFVLTAELFLALVPRYSEVCFLLEFVSCMYNDVTTRLKLPAVLPHRSVLVKLVEGSLRAKCHDCFFKVQKICVCINPHVH